MNRKLKVCLVIPCFKVRDKILGVIIGLVVGGIVISTLQMLSMRYLFDMSAMDPQKPDATNAPVLGLLAVCASYTFGVWAAVATGLKISDGWRFIAVIIGGLFLLGCVLNFLSIPHPFWFIFASVAATIIGIAIPVRKLKD